MKEYDKLVKQQKQLLKFLKNNFIFILSFGLMSITVKKQHSTQYPNQIPKRKNFKLILKSHS